MNNDHPLQFDADSAFVIHFAHPQAPGAPRPGRAEHVTTGRAARFQDEAQLMAFVAEVLESLASEQKAETT